MTSRSVMFDIAFKQLTMPPQSSHDPDFDPDMNFSAKGGVPDSEQPAEQVLLAVQQVSLLPLLLP